MSRIILFANTDWYLYNFRLPLARELRERGNEVILLSPPGAFHHLLQENGFHWVSFPLSRRGVNPLMELLTLWRLFRIYQQIKPEVVHHFTIKPVIYGSLAAHVLGIRQIINSITGLGHLFIDAGLGTRITRGFAKMLYRLCLRHTQVIFENPEDRDTFIQNHLLESRQAHIVLGAGVDVKRFKPSPYKNDIPLVLFAGRLLITKGVLEFVRAAQYFKQKDSKARFAIVGSPDPGNPASISSDHIDAWIRSGVVEAWGWQDDMPSVLAKADIFCLPSYREGVPSVLLEACAAGLPIITTDVPGCRDVVVNNVNGLLVPPQDPQALVTAMEKLVDNPTLRDKMGKMGRQIALDNFSLDKTIEQILSVYQQAAASTGATTNHKQD